MRFYKRAQILVADIWACFNNKSYGHFTDINSITMFADYRVPVILHTLSCITYSPPLTSHIHHKKHLPSGHTWEIQLRGASIWCVEMIKRYIESRHPESRGIVNSILIDFYLYDTAKEMEESLRKHKELEQHREKVESSMAGGQILKIPVTHSGKGKGIDNWEERESKEKGMMIPHHRTRTIWY